MTTYKWIRSFARRSNIEPNISQILENYSIKNTKECIEKIVSSQKKIWIEIGFGDGKNILYHALNKNDVLLIGCEPYLKGVSKLLTNIEKYDIKNIVIWVKDARELIANFPNNSIERFFILFPDPWPKRCHHKKRLINTEFLDLLTQKMLNVGNILIATDHEDYTKWIISHINQCRYLTYTEIEYDSINFPITKYHRKALTQQHKIRFFKIEKQCTIY